MNKELISNIIEFIENVDEILSSRYWYYEGVKEVTNLKLNLKKVNLKKNL